MILLLYDTIVYHFNHNHFLVLIFFFPVVFVVVVAMFIIMLNRSETIRPILSIERYINTSLLLLSQPVTNGR